MPLSRNVKALAPIVMGLLYGVSPIDLIPDVIPILGWLDDAVAVPLLIGLGLLHLMRKERQPARVRVHPPQR